MDRSKVTYRALVVGLAGTALALTAVALGTLARNDVALLSGAPTPEPADLPVVIAEGIGAVVAAWLALGVFLTLGATLAGLRLPVNVLPRSLRRLISAALGISVVVGASVPAIAATPGSAAPTAAATASLDPGWVASQTSTVPSVTPKAPEPPQQHVPKVSAQTHHRVNEAVTVHRGDTLWSIAQRHAQAQGKGHVTDSQVAALWPRWFTANRAAIGPDPDVLHPGTRLHPPTTH